MAQFKIYTIYVFFFFFNKSTVPPCHLSITPEIPPLHYGVTEYVNYCREMNGQGINPEVRIRKGYPLSQRIILQNIQLVGSRGLHFSQIPRSGHGLRSMYSGVRSKVPGICTGDNTANKSGGRKVASEQEWATRLHSAGN